jgi:hypothetical protein
MSNSVSARSKIVSVALIAALASAGVLGFAAPVAAKTTTVSTASQLKSALTAAAPGDTITLAAGTYTGKFVSAKNGTAAAPITLTGPRGAVITTGSIGSGYALNVTGDHWNLSGFSVATAKKGIVLDGSTGSRLDRLDVGSVGEEAVHVRANSADVVIANSSIHHTGLTDPGYGEGIYVGSAASNWGAVMGSSTTPDRSDRVVIENNAIWATSAEGIDVKEGTTGGRIAGNRFTDAGLSGANFADSWVDIKGNGYTVENNSGSGALADAFQVHVASAGWGSGNLFRANGQVTGVPGYEVNVQSTAAGTVVACAPSGAGGGLSNIACS